MFRTLARLRHWSKQHPRTVAAILVLSAVCCFGPWVAPHLSHLWKRQHYQFFPMMVVALVGIAVSRSSSLPKLVPTSESNMLRWNFQIPLLILTVVSLSAAAYLDSPWCGMVAFVACLLLFARNCGDLYPVALCLLLLIPLPFSADTNLIMRLQKISSVGASGLLDTFGIRHMMSGNVLELADRKFFVEEACSGIGSVFLLVATAAVYSVWKRLRTVIVLPLLVSAVIWAVAGNMFRIFAVAFSHASQGPDLGHGLQHDFLGTVAYCLSISLLLLTEGVLQFVFAPIPETQSGGTRVIEYGDKSRRTLIQFWNRRTSTEPGFIDKRDTSRRFGGISVHPPVLMATIVPVLVVFSIVNGSLFWPHVFPPAPISRVAVEIPVDTILSSVPDELFAKSTAVPKLLECRTESRRSGAEQTMLGTHSRIWTLRVAGVEVIASIDGPFETWHDARPAYVHQKWKILQSDSAPSPGIGDGTSMVTRAELYLGDSEHGLLLFGGFRKPGVPIAAPSAYSLSAATRDRVATEVGLQNAQFWQFQMFVPLPAEPDPTTRTYWTQTFLEFYEDVLGHWSRQ